MSARRVRQVKRSTEVAPDQYIAEDYWMRMQHVRRAPALPPHPRTSRPCAAEHATDRKPTQPRPPRLTPRLARPRPPRSQGDEDEEQRLERARAVQQEVMEEERPTLDVELEQADEQDGGGD